MSQGHQPAQPADPELDSLCRAALAGERLDAAQALRIYRGLDLPSLGMLADAVRQRINPGDRVTYIIDRNVNPTNVCVTDCGFCAFYRRPGDPEAYELPREVVYQKIEETLAAGGAQLLLQGGHHPYLKTADFAALFRDIKARYPQIWIHGMSPPEIHHLSRLDKRSVRDVLAELQDAGLDSVPGGGAEILVERVRQVIAPKKATTEQWLDVMRQVAALGMRGTATMMFGHVETDAERIEHMTRIRELQDECGVFTAFIPWTYQPENTALAASVPGKATVAEYLRTLALARLYLQNVPHLQASFVTQGMKTCQVGLAMGADDFGSVMLEENVVSSAGCSHPASVAEIERHIKDAGYVPQRRNMLYQPLPTPETDRFGNPPRQRAVVSSS
ncbi:MAG: dehypoxanthine futalosine cyclase [Planctomycetes bacterium]|nr:dehypoxanthine futalosine cyclase [Planctomycetota bacterium]MCB9889976.1 dehypoxanthine futalosine cyclase [Planctomycetota bacterium]